MNDTPAILSIDQGTSGSKAIIFGIDGSILTSHTQDYPIHHPAPGYVEIDPDTLVSSVYRACRGALAKYESEGRKVSDIRSIGISNQRESFLFWNRRGEPLSPVVVWQCKRSVDYCREISGNPEITSLIRAKTGLLVDPYFSGTKAAVIAAADRNLAEEIKAGRVNFGTVDSWLLSRLSGEFATDSTNASRTMLFDIHRLEWNAEIIGLFGLEGLMLPDVRPSDAGFGSTNLMGLLPSPVSIGAVVGDSHAAAFGEGLFRVGEAKVTLGTGSSILMNVGSTAVSSRNGMVSTLCWSAGGRTDYALEGIVVSCGSTITWLRDKLGIFTDSAEIDTLAEEVSDPEGVYMVPGFSGIGAPWWKLDAKAALLGLDFGHDRRHVARAALESIPFQVADVLSAMAADFGGTPVGVKADGGITASAIVMNGLAALSGCSVHVPDLTQASAWGAALLSGLNDGVYPGLEEIDKLISSQKTRTIETTADPGLLERYRGWRDLLQDY